MKRIVHIITGLNNGGAEMMLYKLLDNLNKDMFQLVVISMSGTGIMSDRIKKIGVTVVELDFKKNLFGSLYTALKYCKSCDIIQTWMYHANFLGYLLNIISKKKLIWGIRRGDLVEHKDKRLTVLIAKLCGKISKRINKVIYCSFNSAIAHKKYGYSCDNAIIIPNGFELDTFYRRDIKRSLLNSLGIYNNPRVILFVGRWEHVKGHRQFIEATSQVSAIFKDFIVLMCGTGNDKDNEQLVQIIESNRLEKQVYLLGRRDDIPNLMSAANIYVSASFTEAFSNVIGEAMACEVPCVVTDVGDSAIIVGETGIVVENNSPGILAQGMIELLSKTCIELSELGKKARKRIVEKYDIKNIVKEYEKLY